MAKRYKAPSWVRCFGRYKHKHSESSFSRKHCQELNQTLNTLYVKGTQGQRCDPEESLARIVSPGLRTRTPISGSLRHCSIDPGLSRRRRRGRAPPTRQCGCAAWPLSPRPRLPRDCRHCLREAWATILTPGQTWPVSLLLPGRAAVTGCGWPPRPVRSVKPMGF